ncbi:hypothetical protein BGL34_06720 [Fructilactobacillus lindneri]|uniref:Uncharacterized protein n=2 Tax=Fructilactobacillus lindneri TaxID=53444 RepID=A0A0R2JRE6_9LACO|nr:hypothetical protein [Fructilactobacillus lindneri]ANZ57631.1 hypothetical protein AYR60_02035 [Fructilactobacillus lindneri]ANZ58901.1 hypothetical protein AYR59_02035 [Fructilactobacillus lindneri]KRN79673.1 hypothetical protein IV52_GL000210 [Fructilactobacillus lindneri DSM 20690 = JCM 11027]POG97620.1 hypothetical protein BGL31_06695 [Fructilactobacillus lindneri]POH03415.1 hypothetical protein BGL32_06830 [Fructilactobacillus lindneri]
MDVHSKKKELKKLIKDQEKYQETDSGKFDAKRFDNYKERYQIVEELIANEEQINQLRSEDVIDPKKDHDNGMDKNRHIEDKMNDLGRAQRRLMDKLLPLENKYDKHKN